MAVSVHCLDDVAPDTLADLPIEYLDGGGDNWSAPPAAVGHL